MRKLILFFIFFLISACASPDFNYRPQSVQVSEPPIDSVSMAYVGDVMLRQGRYTDYEAIYLPDLVRVSWAYDLLPGFYLKKGEDNRTETFLPGSAEPGAINKAALADPWSAVMVYKGEQKICVITVFNARTCTVDANFIRRSAPVMSDDSFQQTLIYSGKVGDKVNIGYREFSNNMARPAFNNDVQYDMGSSRVIGYKGARLEILEATNEFIKYRVISNFNKAEF